MANWLMPSDIERSLRHAWQYDAAKKPQQSLEVSLPVRRGIRLHRTFRRVVESWDIVLSIKEDASTSVFGTVDGWWWLRVVCKPYAEVNVLQAGNRKGWR